MNRIPDRNTHCDTLEKKTSDQRDVKPRPLPGAFGPATVDGAPFFIRIGSGTTGPRTRILSMVPGGFFSSCSLEKMDPDASDL
jgi:hypothetical protein